MTRSPVAASCATVSAIDSGNPTVPGDGTPYPSSTAGWVTMPVAALPSGRITRMDAPMATPRGRSTGTDHQPCGSGGEDATTDRVSGSPPSMFTVAEAPESTGAGIDPTGTGFHSTSSCVMADPAEIERAAKGNGSFCRFERSHPSAATTMAPAANHRRYGGRESQSTASPYRLTLAM